MYIDFNQEDYETVEDYINAIIYDHNYLRPSYALNYKTPIEYRTQLGFKWMVFTVYFLLTSSTI